MLLSLYDGLDVQSAALAEMLRPGGGVDAEAVVASQSGAAADLRARRKLAAVGASSSGIVAALSSRAAVALASVDPTDVADWRLALIATRSSPSMAVVTARATLIASRA